jgi:mono/diheme cytochrome c family protein
MTSRDDSAKPADYTFLMNRAATAGSRAVAFIHKGDMKLRFATLCTIGVAALGLSVGLAAQHTDAAHNHREAAKLKNPVAASAESIASGRKLYDRHCSECHGDTGKGDGMAGEGLDEKPSNLVDGQWEHGSSDGEMFVVIRDGAGPKSEMKAFAKKIPERQIWDVVNFVRTLNRTTR